MVDLAVAAQFLEGRVVADVGVVVQAAVDLGNESTTPSILSKNFLSSLSRQVYWSWTIRGSTSGIVRGIGAFIGKSSTTINSRTASGSPFPASFRAWMAGLSGVLEKTPPSQ